jgi:hypothetical protein
LDALAEGLGATLFLAGFKPTEHPYSAAVVRVLVDFAATSQRCAPPLLALPPFTFTMVLGAFIVPLALIRSFNGASTLVPVRCFHLSL